MKRALICSAMTLCFLSNSVALAQETKQQVLQATASQANGVSAVSARAAIAQIKTLKLMRDMGYVTFSQKNISVKGNEGGDIVINLTPKALDNINTFSSGVPHKAKALLEVGSLMSALGAPAATLAAMYFNNSAKDPFSGRDIPAARAMHLRNQRYASGTSIVLATSGAGSYAALAAGENYDAGQAKIAAEQIMNEKSFNDGVNAMVSETEQLYNLQNIQSYKHNRSEFISKYKGIVSSDLVKSMIEEKDKKNFNITSSYAEFLNRESVIPWLELKSMAVVLDFLSQKEINLKDNKGLLIPVEKQLNNLRLSLEILANDSSITEVERQEIRTLQKTIEREILGLQMLNANK